jgi:hypothetical protein
MTWVRGVLDERQEQPTRLSFITQVMPHGAGDSAPLGHRPSRRRRPRQKEKLLPCPALSGCDIIHKGRIVAAPVPRRCEVDHCKPKAVLRDPGGRTDQRKLWRWVQFALITSAKGGL